jgi:hypothetical protein
MAILDGLNIFSNVASGDSPTDHTIDNPSASVIDQNVSGSAFTDGGGAYVAPFVIVRVNTAVTSGGSTSVLAVVQDSPDNVTFTDRIVGATIAKASLTAGAVMLAQRLLPNMARYIRVIYRMTGSNDLTAGTFMSFLTLDADVIDLSLRQAAATFTMPSGAMNQTIGNSVLDS